ncbi:PTS mannose/fructose/sorbose transporter subunit IIC [Lacticaseibacillus pantheris]|jgi:PTS system mannose-specific IIC component|uniref:PTS mannose/fructose/sorbose transporter subunit IIC n=1 Tax=Lacticaseibacillus pantheris TaxID=171523 RepID=UPI0006D14BA5|nr:PTS mannose/fructose/sorbose transporter subunit IIC [Lacticaseibacillus pantheris]WKF84075.1 PTS mannose/fructose/sorbose transporter subunit IIC [Lacticaseibacillus pantheris]
MSFLSIIGILIVSFLAGMEGVLDQFEFHQPILACSLIGLASGHPAEGLALGGSLQLIALGWMNIGAAVAPDAALASVAAAILVCVKNTSVSNGVALAIPLAVAGLVLTILVRTVATFLAHGADAAGKRGSFAGVYAYHFIALSLQGLRIAIPAALIMAVPTHVVTDLLAALPDIVTNGLKVGGGMIVAVGYAMVINMMATPALWPWFFLGFALASLSEITLIGMGIIGVVLALLFLQVSPEFNKTSGGSSSDDGGDPIDDILNDY